MKSREERKRELKKMTDEQLQAILRENGIRLLEYSREKMIDAILNFDFGEIRKSTVQEIPCPECEKRIPMIRVGFGIDDKDRRFDKMECPHCEKNWRVYFNKDGDVEMVIPDDPI
jgi:hypothetical protein